MPDYESIFETLGVFARAFASIENFAERDLAVTENGQTIRSLDQLRSQFVAILNDSSAERDALSAVAVLSDAARAAQEWQVALGLALDDWLRGPLALELAARGATRDEVVRQLVRAMHADGESVARNEVSIDAIEPGGNAGDTALHVSADTVDAAESVITDQRVRTQRIALECTRDHPRHRVTVGQEEFRLRPEYGPALNLRVIPVTYGDVPDARNTVADGAFEDAGLAHWSVEAGLSAVSRDTALKRFGAASLRIAGDGATAVDVRQDLAQRDPALPAGAFLALGAWVYVTGHTAGSVVIDLLLDSQPSQLQLVIDGDTPTGQWLHLGGFAYAPRASFANKVIVRIACAATFDGAVNLDGVSLAPAVEAPHAGLRVALFEGALAAQAGDRFSIDTSSDDAGAFQVFARGRLGVALPAADTPTIDDQLAE